MENQYYGPIGWARGNVMLMDTSYWFIKSWKPR